MTIARLEGASDEALFGGKAASLARALGAGLPVPGGFAIGWSSVQDEAAIASAYRALNADLVAVRSSAIGEDSADASFAGQHATILNVASEAELLAAVASIRDSASSEHALAYRARMGLDGAPRIAVVVQKMVDADVAGVLFTRNPITGANERLIESSWGLGEAVVAGLVSPDRFRVSVDGAVLERVNGRKDIAIRRHGEEPVPQADWHRLSLSDAQLIALHRLAATCERLYGAPVDLEWAFHGNELSLLQSRPITTVAPPSAESPAADSTFMARNPVELSPRRFAGLGLAALLAPLNSTIIAVALPSIAAAFTTTPATATRWLITAYLFVTLVAQSPSGKLADLWGTGRILTLGRAMFALGALVAGLSPSLGVLSAGRVLMAIGGALSIPTVFAILRTNVPPEKRGRVFGLFGAIMSGAAAAGPILGGFLTERYGWHSVFIVNVPVVVLSFLLEPPAMRRPRSSSAGRFDYAGSALLAVIALLLVGGVERQDLFMTVAAVALIALFVWQQRRAADPVVDVRLFRARPFATAAAIIALQNLAMYGMLFLIPFVLATRGSGAAETGKILLLFTLSMVVASPLGGRASDAIGPRAVAITGALVATAGAVLFAGSDGLAIAVILTGAGMGLTTGPAQAAGMSAIPSQQAGVAAGVLATVRYAGGIVGSGIVALLAASRPGDPRLYVFPAVLFMSALVAPALSPREKGSRGGAEI